MIKRKIDPKYLRMILSPETPNKNLDALDFALSLKKFAEGLMRGTLEVEVIGNASGEVPLKMTVVSYLIRLLCEAADTEPARCTVTLADTLEVKTEYPAIDDIERTAYLIDVAKLAGFKVTRKDDTLFFKVAISTSAIMKIYAVSSDEIMYWLVKTSQM